jgi:hypothetical protein
MTTQSERYARTQWMVTAPENLPAAHEQHRHNTAAHASRLQGDAEKIARLQNWPEGQLGVGSVPPPLNGMFSELEE